MEEKYILTKQEVGRAIVAHIGMLKGKGFYPCKIVGTDEGISLPDTITFKVAFVPKGGKVAEHDI